MAIDINQIQLTDAERQLLAEVAERTGKSWSEVLQEALRQYRETGSTTTDNGRPGESWHDSLSRHGLVGCLHGGPPDLSTNLEHMEGFGKDEL